MNTTDNDIENILKKYQAITVVGYSGDNTKPAHRVPHYMLSKGYAVLGVNPNLKESGPIKVYADLSDVPKEHRKLVNIFRKPEAIPEIVEKILKLGSTEVIWLQLGITNEAAESLAESAGIKVVSDRCILIEHKKYF